MPEPIREMNAYDDTDRHLMAALQSVEIPTDLRARLERSLLDAHREHDPQALPIEPFSKAERTDSPVLKKRSSVLNRRTAIAAAVAAGIGGIAFGFRQIWQPLSQTQLVIITQKLLNDIGQADWQDLTGEDVVAIKRSLQDVGFVRQVRDLSMVQVTQLQTVGSVKHVRAYQFDRKFVLLDLTLERSVQRLSQSLSELPWTSSDLVAFAMSNDDRTLVFVGPAAIRHHILPAQTT